MHHKNSFLVGTCMLASGTEHSPDGRVVGPNEAEDFSARYPLSGSMGRKQAKY